MNQSNFPSLFKSLTGHPPFPWQVALYQEFVEGKVPLLCSIPTGLGKTMVIVVWLLALANPERKQPRRLVYVVNRRTIVDQATDLISSIREKLGNALGDSTSALYATACKLRQMDCFGDEAGNPLAVSTLRGELADNEEWKSNPTKPAVIIGTVDMIGSKLLFSGYGDSRRTRPLHAAFLGCDTIFIHDEAHLTPAFGKLLKSIKQFQENAQSNIELEGISGIKVLELSATHWQSRSSNSEFGLSEEDHSNPVVKKRLEASKALHLHEVSKDGAPLLKKISELALEYITHREACRVVVLVRKPDDVQKLAAQIEKRISDAMIEEGVAASPGNKLSLKERKLIKVAAEG
ncbi:MAG: type I-U CRISPR-associated helicase/endonuclease Cas3, partial [Verrucomicrobia bacterium]|nr:type I-U CRISPR-associated helicase/endonuclease Cas3 [Verrucomicrobiota bacterium]